MSYRDIRKDGDIWEKIVLGSGNGLCKDFEVGIYLYF